MTSSSSSSPSSSVFAPSPPPRPSEPYEQFHGDYRVPMYAPRRGDDYHRDRSRSRDRYRGFNNERPHVSHHNHDEVRYRRNFVDHSVDDKPSLPCMLCRRPMCPCKPRDIANRLRFFYACRECRLFQWLHVVTHKVYFVSINGIKNAVLTQEVQRQIDGHYNTQQQPRLARREPPPVASVVPGPQSRPQTQPKEETLPSPAADEAEQSESKKYEPAKPDPRNPTVLDDLHCDDYNYDESQAQP